MSDTPETDALEQKQSSEGCPQWNDMMRWVREHAALACKLERERDEAREQNAKMRYFAERILLNCETLHPNTVKLHRAELEQIKEGAK